MRTRRNSGKGREKQKDMEGKSRERWDGKGREGKQQEWRSVVNIKEARELFVIHSR